MKLRTGFPIRWIPFALLCSLVVGQAAERARETLHETHPLTADGRVEIENTTGDIRVTTWERDEVSIDAVKTASHKSDLDAVKIVIKAEKDRIEVKTRFPDGRKGQGNPTSVDYSLRVPYAARLKKISTVNGDVLIENARGEVDASSVNGGVSARGLSHGARLKTVNGRIEAAFEKLAKDQPVTTETVNGSIRLTLPASAAADVSADTLNGGLKSDFDLPVVRHKPVGSDMRGSLGAGGAKLRAHTINGSIEIRKAE